MATTSSNQEMRVSVSFGMFENDSLSWEKFSSFSPNKYLEEVEKCATPGSVAQKKAYFESQYKKIADRKAEIIIEQERNESSEIDKSMMLKSSAFDGLNGESTKEEDNPVTSIATEVNEASINEPLKETMNFEECQSEVDVVDDLITLKLEKLEGVEEKPELIVQVEDKEKPEMVGCMEVEVKEDISSMDTTKKEKGHKVNKKIDKNARTNHTKGPTKASQVNKKPVASKKTEPSKEKSMTRATEKAALPVSKPRPGFSTPRLLKPSSTTISSMSTSRSSLKKEDASTFPRKKQTAPKSLNNSLNMDQPGSDSTALATSRKSLIMERMGDKDIVRRAFKTFQKNFDQLKPSGDEQDPAPKQVATSVSRLATTGQKEKGSSSFVPKSNKKTGKQELFRLGERDVERIRLQAKPKAEATNAKTRKQSLDPKAKSRGTLPVQSTMTQLSSFQEHCSV